jgi:hypothetical protein
MSRRAWNLARIQTERLMVAPPRRRPLLEAHDDRVKMKWITREKIKVDRVACPWLIRNFVDRNAEFLFLPHDTDWSKVQSGTVFDVPNCELGHQGEDVSFNSILKKYQLTEPALVLLGEIVRAADSHPNQPHPAGEGLRWIAHGFAALELTDHEILDREFIVYDALYAECRKRVAADPGKILYK